MAQERDPITHERFATEPNRGHSATDSAHDTQYTADGRSSEEIRRDAAHTRDEMSETIDALERRLNPRTVLNHVLDALKDDARRSHVLDALRRNPIPTMVLAAGAAWLAVDIFRDRHEDDEYELDREYYARLEAEPTGDIAVSEPAGRYMAEGDEGDEGSRMDAAKEKLGEARHRAGEKAGELKNRASDAAHHLADRARGAGRQARHRMHDATGRARRGAGRARRHAEHRGEEWMEVAHDKAAHVKETLADSYESHPLALGAAAVAAGVLVGLLLPSTRKEDEWMGDVRDDMVDHARDAAEDIGHRAESVAHAAVQGATDAAREQGATPEAAHDVVDEVSQKARDIADRAKEEARKEAQEQNLTAEGIADKARETAAETKEDAQRKAQQKKKPQ